MKKLVAVCVVAAVAGGLFGIRTASVDRLQPALAQEAVRRLPLGTGANAEAEAPPAAARPQVSNPWPPEAEEFTPEERTNILVYEKANRSVVHIKTKDYSPDTFFSLEGPSEGAGSGSVLDKNGHILTNNHVIENATELVVTLHNGVEYDGSLVGRDPLSDIAVLRITAPPASLFPIEFGDSARLRVGQKVLAIGNPFGLERTLTVGTLSSLNRTLATRERQLRSMIQIDAALNRGNSGGPLLNSQGRMIGMNTAILSPTGQNIGVGFALPVNTIRRVVAQLIEHGRVIRPVIGIASVYETDAGLMIIEVTPGGPAERAGLRGRVVTKREKRGFLTMERRYIDRANPPDLIVAANGQPLTTGDALQEFLDAQQPGDRIVMRVRRGGQLIEVPVVLGASE